VLHKGTKGRGEVRNFVSKESVIQRESRTLEGGEEGRTAAHEKKT